MSSHIETPTRLYFPAEAEAPFGELNLILGDSNYSSPEGSVALNNGYMSVVRIIKDAWLSSQWLPDAIGDEKLDEVKRVWYPTFARKAVDFRGDTWYAVLPPAHTKDYAVSYGLSNSIAPEQVVGFAHAKNAVSGNFFEKAYKRLCVPEKVYACVPNVDVAKAHQKNNIGAALFYAALSGFRPDQKPTTYIMATHQSMIEKLGKVGFVATGSHVRTDLIEGAELQEVRLVAESVEAVRGKLAESFPWLTAAIDVS